MSQKNDETEKLRVKIESFLQAKGFYEFLKAEGFDKVEINLNDGSESGFWTGVGNETSEFPEASINNVILSINAIKATVN
jgi:hypothetical protein